MLEPLIVLTVLNCFFMFSSTATTCALWWQYRSHRCCYKKDPGQQAARHALSKLKSSHASKDPKKACSSKQDNPGNGVDRSKSNSTVNRDSKSRRRQKRSSSIKYPVQTESPSEEHENSMDIAGEWQLEERTRMSEASQTGNDVRPAVVMEYSTVQKIVQILDDDADLLTTRMAIKDRQAKQHAEEKKADLDAEIKDKLERPSLIAYTPSES
ncbi:uncharacterized protein LOC143373851 [Andrena cerasifolii]|uniref:uncharacterized protein LOC143373851 n=1 Tax=Andrena cerasifolii TaxID=2819439 RepID=UPI00403766AB